MVMKEPGEIRSMSGMCLKTFLLSEDYGLSGSPQRIPHHHKVVDYRPPKEDYPPDIDFLN